MGLVGFVIELTGNTEPRKSRLVRCFERFGKTGGLEHLVVYNVFVNNDGFGAGRRSRKP